MTISQKIKDLCIAESSEWLRASDPERQKMLGEVFTPTPLVLEMIEQLPPTMWEDGKTFLDPTCGNGQFLAAIAIIKRELGHKSVLSSVYGVDIMNDNVQECRNRLLDIAGRTKANKKIVNRNIVCADGLKYDYSFNGSNKTVEESVFDNLFKTS